MTTIDPDLQKRLGGLIQDAKHFADSGETNRALKALRSAQQTAVDNTTGDLRAQALTEIGYIAFRMGALNDAENAFQDVLDGHPGEVGDNLLISARLGLGLLYTTAKRFPEAVVQFSTTVELAERIGADNLSEVAHRNLGECYLELEEYEKALPPLSAALVLAQKHTDVDNQSSLLGSLGRCHIRLNKPSAAQGYYEQRLSLAQDREDVATIGVTKGDLGNVHALLGQFRVALDYYREARAIFAQQEGTQNTVAYLDSLIVRAAQSIGDELVAYVSRSIADSIVAISSERAKKQLQPRDYRGDLKQDVLCGLLALVDDFPEIQSHMSHIGFHEPPRISTPDVLGLVGDITRTISDQGSPDPRDLFEAARFITQIHRGLRAVGLLDRIRKGEVGPDISGSGHGRFLLYLRSFVAAPVMPRYRLALWGDVDLEEALASKLEQGPWPLIALGDPEVQSFGAGKIQTDDATWQDDLILLGKHADMVLVAPCATEGTSWEIEWVVINKFLKKTVFIMPPSSGDSQQWWKENWAALQRWSRYLGLAFPDYIPDGLFFSLATGEHIATRAFETVLASDELWQTIILDVAGQFLPSDEWLVGLRDTMPGVMFQEEAKERGLDVDTLSQEKVEKHVARIENRIRQLEPRLLDNVSPYKLGMLEKGLPPQGDFAMWPPERGRIPSAPSLYTIWEGPKRLMWVGTTLDPFATLDSHAEGRLENDGFTTAVLNQLVLPGLSEALRLDVEKGLLPMDKMVRFKIRRSFRYKLLPMQAAEARIYEDLIRHGVLDAGPPALDYVK